MMEKKLLIELLKNKGFSKKIVQAFQKVKREDFVKPEYQQYAYLDGPLPIADKATISQPQTIAFMLDLLEIKDGNNILEIGSGSGYVLALINAMAKKLTLYGVEINPELVERSRKTLPKKIKIIQQSGEEGYPEKAPYDRILVSAAFAEKPVHLIAQLKKGGILVSPVGNYIYKWVKNDEIIEEAYYGFTFVPIQQVTNE